MSTIIVFEEPTDGFTVSFTQDDVTHTWTAIRVVNNASYALRVSGDVNGILFSANIGAGITADRLVTIPLTQITNAKGTTAWLPGTLGVPTPFSIRVNQI